MAEVADSVQLRRWLDAGCEAGRLAGQVLLKWRSRFQIREKGQYDLVTDADIESQRVIHEHLVSRFPTHQILGEEGGPEEKDPGPNAPPTWIVDPVDGTSNYAHDFPFYCTSIGLQVAGELVVGVIYDPLRDEMFSAASGQGAFLNGKRISVTSHDRLDKAMVTTGFPYQCQGREALFDWWRYFSLNAQALRRTGSTALHLAYVASGRAEVFYAFDNHAWDVAAGAVIVREAGGKISNLVKPTSRFNPFQPDCLATNAALHPFLADRFAKGPDLSC
jgi:myo-inositol-1(or 4)-monophosphatase